MCVCAYVQACVPSDALYFGPLMLCVRARTHCVCTGLYIDVCARVRVSARAGVRARPEKEATTIIIIMSTVACENACRYARAKRGAVSALSRDKSFCAKRSLIMLFTY